MPAVLVHGNPETPALWGPLRSYLQRTDVITPQLPGFGVPAASGFGATKEEYVDWLVGEIEAVGEPVDLVGHDWGGGFVARLATLRPDLLRSWVIDVAGIFDPEYVWHDLAQLWQAPGGGEQWVADTLAAGPEARAQMYQTFGISPEVAKELADAFDEEMGRSILVLYRSAPKSALDEWAKDLEAAAARPGLVVIAAGDPFVGGQALAERSAGRMGARSEVLDGVGHWWMLEDPKRGAEVLERFWASVS
jgi:pimeloyl-ACP methyl ester carboxylesterase